MPCWQGILVRRQSWQNLGPMLLFVSAQLNVTLRYYLCLLSFVVVVVVIFIYLFISFYNCFFCVTMFFFRIRCLFLTQAIRSVTLNREYLRTKNIFIRLSWMISITGTLYPVVSTSGKLSVRRFARSFFSVIIGFHIFLKHFLSLFIINAAFVFIYFFLWSPFELI